MIHLSSLMTKFINLIFYLILILKTISVIIFTYYFVLTKKIKTFNPYVQYETKEDKHIVKPHEGLQLTLATDKLIFKKWV